MDRKECKHDCLIIGAGIAGLTSAWELLERGRKVLVLDRMPPDAVGGLARESFGGINIVDSPIQRLNRIKDSPELAYEDWLSFADFSAADELPRRWARFYAAASRQHIHDWLRARGVRFFPVVHWVERGLFSPGNSVPRFHMIWGTGKELVDKVKLSLATHPKAHLLTFAFDHRAEELLLESGRVVGCRGETSEGKPFIVRADQVILASGGFIGNLEKVRENWSAELGTAPQVLLNGAHDAADGLMHDAVAAIGGNLTHLDLQWNYAAGVHHPKPLYREHGLSLIPPHSALWLNYRGERIGPVPLITSFDTRYLVSAVCHEKRAYSWQLMNWKIAVRELAVSGATYNEEIRDKRLFSFLRVILSGNRALVERLTRDCVDFVVADTLPELVAKMNALNGDDAVELDLVAKEVQHYDGMIDRGHSFYNDEQLRRIEQLRSYRGDRVRTCSFQKILEPSAAPLIAIREFILSRKSLGGVQTDLNSRVLRANGEVIEGLYAVGEAAGFGGGGIHGKRALEGTFLGSCILTAQAAAAHIGEGRTLAQAL